MIYFLQNYYTEYLKITGCPFNNRFSGQFGDDFSLAKMSLKKYYDFLKYTEKESC